MLLHPVSVLALLLACCVLCWLRWAPTSTAGDYSGLADLLRLGAALVLLLIIALAWALYWLVVGVEG